MRVASSKRAASVLVLSLAALLAVGCDSDPIAPSDVAGTYVLLSINGKPLPAPPDDRIWVDTRPEVVADTLRLAADGSGSSVRVQEMIEPIGDDTTVFRVESPLHYRTTEGGIAITFDCPPNALMSCVAGPHITARLSATGLVATQNLGSESAELVYASVQRLD